MPAQELDPSGVKILDGAVRVLGDFGFKRATVELVAKYAGVSHMTIYRRWPSKNELLTTAVIGELTTLLDTAFGQAFQSCTEFADRSLNAFTDTVWAVQNHPIAVRELNSESGEHSALLSSYSGAVMDVSVPLIADRLAQLDEGSEDAPADLDAVADVFVRLAYSLVTVKRTSQPLASRAEIAAYAGESFGPYLLGLQPVADSVGTDVPVIDLATRRSARDRDHRPYLQIAAASLVGFLTLGAGLTAVLGGDIKIPFITPANISRSGIPATPTNLPPAPTAPNGSGSEEVSGASVVEPAAPGSTAGPSAADPGAIPAGIPVVIPSADPGQAAVAVVGSNGGNAGGNAVVDKLPVLVNPAPAPPRPTPGPQPLKPGPQPLNPSPQPPKPGPPPPPGPGPQPTNLAPKPPNPAPKPPNPGPKPPGPGPQGGQQGGQQPGPGPAN